MTSKIEYLAGRRKSIEKSKQKSVFEKHHVLGRINSEETIDLPKPWHDFITHSQNSISVGYRNHPKILGISSLIGLNELVGEQMRNFREMMLKELESAQNG